MRDLDRVGQHVLPVARAVVQPAEQLRQLRVQRPDVRLEHRLLADLDDPVLDLRARLVVRLLDSRRMDAPVLEQLLERQSRDFASDPVEAGEDHSARRVVDDEVDAGEHLQRADVAPLAPDDAALQVVRLQRDHRHRRLVRVAAGESLHAGREDAASAPVRLAARLLLHLAHELRAVVAQFVLQFAQQDLARLRRAEAGDPLELAYVFALGRLQLVGRDVEIARAVLERGLAPGKVLQARM